MGQHRLYRLVGYLMFAQLPADFIFRPGPAGEQFQRPLIGLLFIVGLMQARDSRLIQLLPYPQANGFYLLQPKRKVAVEIDIDPLGVTRLHFESSDLHRSKPGASSPHRRENKNSRANARN
jgi:hypothetical protein